MSSANESAYPVQTQSFPARDGDYTVHESIGGLTKREAFAMAAMQALIGTAEGPCLAGLDGFEPYTAQAACRMADAMLAALEITA